jgi:hypothetical protein
MMNFNSWEMMAWDQPGARAGIGLLAIWSLVWSGLSLWKSARNGDRYWFLALLLIHTAGILDILYLFVFAKNKLVLVSEPVKPVKKTTRKK